MKRKKLIILDNNLTFRQRLIFLINVEKSVEIIGEASTGEEFLQLLTNHQPDLILMDVDIPHLKGIEVVRKAMKLFPGLKIFAFTMFGDDTYIINLIKSGVKGFILKSSAVYELDKAIHSLLTDENYSVDNQIINVLKKLNENKLLISKNHKRISSSENKYFHKNHYSTNGLD
jgi:DNA-binding NarL/FixJ family response regulator